MGDKSYLKQQIQLISLNIYDLFTEEEYEAYQRIIEAKNQMNLLESQNAPKEEFQQQNEERIKNGSLLKSLVSQHCHQPRQVRLKGVIYHPKDSESPFPSGASWNNLKESKKICEFVSELSRAMGMKPMDATMEKIVISWNKNLEILQQLVLNGLFFDLLQPDGTVVRKHYRCYTASAGQLRTDKCVFMSDDMWFRVKDRIECGLTWEIINQKGGVNINKYMAYLALPNSATDEWEDFDIDRCIVIPEFKSIVTDRMMYIKPDYTYETGVRSVEIDHTDGCGMILPSLSESNFMVRGPYVKGLLCSFDFMKFCRIQNVRPVIEDVWGEKHDLVSENIQIIFTVSQFKMWKYYASWNEYKTAFKKCGARFGKMNYEETEIKNVFLNYQMIQTLTDFTDEEIARFVARPHEQIENLTKDKDSMLRVLNANELSDNPYKASLAVYPPLLREAYTKNQLRDIRKRMLLDAKSGKIKVQNKRLYAIPDLYAACEFWFLKKENPKGLLKNGEVACRIFRRHEKADVLRSPHLYMEHAIRYISHDEQIYEWFHTNGIYTSCHDLISRILQFDVDGDQLNVVVDPLFVDIAERNVKKYDVIPLFYDAGKSDPEVVSEAGQFHGLKRAHEYSGIGEISNMLTKLWNRPNPDRLAAAWLTMYNNLVIDAAKSGQLNTYENYPEVASRINKAVGGKRGLLPAFFEFSKNGRKEQPQKKKKSYAKLNQSTMNRICNAFSDIGNINLNYAGVSQFNWQMLLSAPCTEQRPEIPLLFCNMDALNLSDKINASDIQYMEERELKIKYEILANKIANELIAQFGSLETAYPYVAKHLFAGESEKKSAHKQMFWRVFGEIALKNLRENIETCDVCEECGMSVPTWAKHTCIKNKSGFFECIDCGKQSERTNSRQCRCLNCQQNHRRLVKLQTEQTRRKKQKEHEEEVKMKRITSLRSSPKTT